MFNAKLHARTAARGASLAVLAPIVVASPALAQTAASGVQQDVCKPPVEPSTPRDTRYRLGFAVGPDWGVSGHLANGATAEAVGPEFSLPVGPLRWHFWLAFETMDALDAYSGVRIEALDVGLPTELQISLPRGARLEIEPRLIEAVEVLVNDGHEILGSTVMAAEATLSMDTLYVSLLPVGLELREWATAGNGASTATAFSTGFDYVVRASGGVRF